MPQHPGSADNPTKRSKSKRQVAFLLSTGTPLQAMQKRKLKRELTSGAVKVRG